MTLVGYANGLGQHLSSGKKDAKGRTWRCVSLSPEYMPEVTLTSSTGDLRPSHSRRVVYVAGYGAWDG